MSQVLELIQETCEQVVFGNGWLAAGGVMLVVVATAVIRLSPGIRV